MSSPQEVFTDKTFGHSVSHLKRYKRPVQYYDDKSGVTLRNMEGELNVQFIILFSYQVAYPYLTTILAIPT